VTFPAGIPATIANALSFFMSRNVNGKQAHLQSSAEHGGPVYASDAERAPSSTQYAIGIFNPREATVRMSTQVMDLFTVTPVTADPTTSGSAAVGSYAETRRVLFDEFGSKKKKRALKSIEMNTIDITKACSVSAFTSAYESAADIKSTVSVSTPASFLPQYDDKTTVVDDIYRLEHRMLLQMKLWLSVRSDRCNGLFSHYS